MLWFKGGPPPQQYVTPHVPMFTPLPGGVFGLGQLFDHSGRGRELFWLSKVMKVYQATEAWPSPQHALQSLRWLTSMTTLSVESESVTLTEVIAGCYSPTTPQSCRPLSSTLSTSSQHNGPPFYPSTDSSAGWPISLLFRCFLLCFAHFDGCIRQQGPGLCYDKAQTTSTQDQGARPVTTWGNARQNMPISALGGAGGTWSKQ